MRGKSEKVSTAIYLLFIKYISSSNPKLPKNCRAVHAALSSSGGLPTSQATSSPTEEITEEQLSLLTDEVNEIEVAIAKSQKEIVAAKSKLDEKIVEMRAEHADNMKELKKKLDEMEKIKG